MVSKHFTCVHRRHHHLHCHCHRRRRQGWQFKHWLREREWERDKVCVCVKTSQDYITNAHSLTENINAGFHFDFDFKLVHNSQYNLLLLIFCLRCCPHSRTRTQTSEQSWMEKFLLFVFSSYIYRCVLFVLFSCSPSNTNEFNKKRMIKTRSLTRISLVFISWLWLMPYVRFYSLSSIATALIHILESHRCMIAKFVRLLDMDHVETRVEIIMTKI